jgi:NADH dehydrogenase [ubiquinone] 1 alpha subcomplex assembly factor 7
MTYSEVIDYIKLNGFITIDVLMELCLSASDGYYKTSQKIIGADGDFITAPDICQLFGEIIGLWCISEYQNLNHPAKINIVELGPGKGSLMRDLLRIAKLDVKFYNALAVSLLEINPTFKKLQRNVLSPFNKEITWIEDIKTLPQIPTIFIANEFFDAMPIKQYIKSENMWRERVVKFKNSKLIYDKIAIASSLSTHLQEKYHSAEDGAIIEQSAKSKYFIQLIASHISNNLGSTLVIDYGYFLLPDMRVKNQYNSTLQAIKNHKFCSILENLGGADLSSHVDFYELASCMNENGVIINKPLTQREFLLSYGIDLRKMQLQKNLSIGEGMILDNQVQRLTNPKSMGNLFKVLSFAHSYN